MDHNLLNIFLVIPLAGFIVSLFIPEKNEKALSTVSFLTVGLHFALLLIFIFLWAANNFQKALKQNEKIALYQQNYSLK